MVTVHEYLVTPDYRRCGDHEAKCRVVQFVRTLPDERPAPPPPPPYVAAMSAWAAAERKSEPPPAPPHS